MTLLDSRIFLKTRAEFTSCASYLVSIDRGQDLCIQKDYFILNPPLCLAGDARISLNQRQSFNVIIEVLENVIN